MAETVKKVERVTDEMVEAGLRITLSSVGLPAGECLHETDVREVVGAAMSASVRSYEDFTDYDCGLINDFGGGDVGWWQDYVRAEIGRANDFWREQVASIEGRTDA